MNKGSFWLTLFLILVGVVVGSLAASLAAPVSWLSWLSYGLTFGMTSPLVLNLGVVSFTFAVSLDLNVAVILFIALALLLGRLLLQK